LPPERQQRTPRRAARRSAGEAASPSNRG
jgi:hypothetical protein